MRREEARNAQHSESGGGFRPTTPTCRSGTGGSSPGWRSTRSGTSCRQPARYPRRRRPEVFDQEQASSVNTSCRLDLSISVRTCPVAGMVTLAYTGSRSRYSRRAILNRQKTIQSALVAPLTICPRECMQEPFGRKSRLAPFWSSKAPQGRKRKHCPPSRPPTTSRGYRIHKRK